MIKVLVLEKKGGVTESDEHQQTLSGKFGKKTAYKYVGATMIQLELNVNGVCITENDKFAQAFCLSMVHTGVNKCISNSTILENYQAGINAMEVYHQFVTRTATPGLEDVTLQPPVEIAVNRKNIHLMEKTILDAYIAKEGSLYNDMRKSEFGGIVHDGIATFSNEFNGVYIRGVNINDDKPFVVPYSLQKMPAGVNAYTLIEALVKTFAKFMNVKGSAFETIKNYIKPDDNIDFSVSLPPTYFNLGKVLNVDDDSKIINIKIMNSPIGNCGGGVAVDQKDV